MVSIDADNVIDIDRWCYLNSIVFPLTEEARIKM